MLKQHIVAKKMFASMITRQNLMLLLAVLMIIQSDMMQPLEQQEKNKLLFFLINHQRSLRASFFWLSFIYIINLSHNFQ